MRRLLLMILLVLALVPPVAAQPAGGKDVRLLSTKVADVLAKFPAGSPAERDKLAEELLGLGDEGLRAVVKQLEPAGSGKDTAVRFALNAVAAYASKALEPKRLLAERCFASAVGTVTDVEVRTFLLSQLRFVGRDVAVKAAIPLFADEKMVEPATQLMLTVRTPAATAALLTALDGARGPARVTIVKALGELNASVANARLLKLAGESDASLVRAVLGALSRIASPDSAATLTAAATKDGYIYAPDNATGFLLEYAKRLGANRSRGAAEQICRQVMKDTNAPGRLATRTAALSVLADIVGTAALPELLQAIDHADVAYRHAALLRAEKLTPVDVDRWQTKAKAVDALRRAEIIAMLGRLKDPRAAAFIRASLATREPEVVLASADALGHMERAKAVPDLLAALKTAPQEAVPGVAAVLGWTIDDKGLDPLVAMLDSLQPAGKAVALDIVGSRAGKRFANRVMPLASDANPIVRAAATKSLAGVVSAEHLPALLLMLDSRGADGKPVTTDDAALVPDLQNAVAAAALQVKPEDARAKPVLAAMKTASYPERFVAVLPQIGGKDALTALVGLFEGNNAALKDRAFRALVDWRGPEAAERLFGVYADATLRDQAFAGFVRQVSSSSIPEEQKVLRFRNALALNPTVRERRQLLAALGRTKTLQAFMVAASYLDDAELKNDAAAAAIKAALPTPGIPDGLSGAVVRATLQKVIDPGG